MATLRTGQTTDLSSQGTEFEVDYLDTDGEGQKGTGYTPAWTKWHGHYRKIPELRAMINKFASWTFGRGIKGEDKEIQKLARIRGFGKDSPRSVLKNQWRTALICGDSFAHKIRDTAKRLTNLKPLNPGHIRIEVDKFGILINYEDVITGRKYDSDEIYHLSYERIANEIHGIPFPEALEDLIINRNEAITDLRELYHKNVFPTDIYEAETDDTTKLTALTKTLNDAFKKKEHIVIPAGVFKEIKKVSTGQSGNLNSLDYIKFLVRQFITACGMPEIIMGWGENTSEASANIIYLAFQQEIEDMQLYNQEQIKEQLGIEIDLEFPASLENKITQNQEKKGEGTSLDPNKDG